MAAGNEGKLDLRKSLSTPVEAEIAIGSEVSSAGKAAQATTKRKLVGWILTGFLLLATLALAAATYFRRGTTNAGVIRLSLLLPEDATFEEKGGPLLSPDGRRLAFAASDSSGKSFLWIRPLDASTAQALPGTDGASQPFWSPDSRWIGFSAKECKTEPGDFQVGGQESS